MASFMRGRRWSMLVLAAYLILVGLIALFGLTFNSSGLIVGALALAAGILILIDR